MNAVIEKAETRQIWRVRLLTKSSPLAGTFDSVVCMLRKPLPEQTVIEMVSLDGLVPKNHPLRKIDAVIDFSFIHDRVAGLYCADNGRPPLDPTLMFKALFIGYLFGVRSERRLVSEIEVNVAYRWFLGLKLTDPVFDASTLSQNRRRRYNDTTVAQDIFDAIVQQAIAKGLVDGTVLYTDSTHLKANANKNRYDTAVVAKSRADYWEALDAAIEDDRAEHGEKPLKDKPREPVQKDTKVSRTDPESGYMVRDGKPKGFFYLDHRTVDGRLGIITDTHATPANVHDSIVYLGRLDRQRQRFGFDVGAVGLDAGYATSGISAPMIRPLQTTSRDVVSMAADCSDIATRRQSTTLWARSDWQHHARSRDADVLNAD